MLFVIGTTLRITCSPRDPETGLPQGTPEGYTAKVDFWGPGLDRAVDLPSLANQAMAWDSANGYFELELDTLLLAFPGPWAFDASVIGPKTKIDTGVFMLKN